MIRAIAAAICAVLFSPLVSAQRDDPHRQRVSDGPIEWVLSLEAREAKVAEPITLRLDVDAPAGSSFTFPDWGERLGQWFVVDSTVTSELPLEGENTMRRWTLTLQLEAIDAGEKQIPRFEVEYRLPDRFADSAGSLQRTFATQPVTIQITSALEPQDDARQFRDIKDEMPVPQKVERQATWLWWAAAALTFATAGGTLLWLRSRRPPAARSWALEEVDRLESQFAAESISLSETYSGLSTVIRQYLQAELSIPATSQSSQELCGQLQQASCPESALERLRQFMSEADEVKFSGRSPSEAKRAGSVFDSVRSIIRDSIPDPRPAIKWGSS